MPTAAASSTEALFAEMSREIQRSIRDAALDRRSTVGDDWGRRQHIEAQAYLGLPASPLESAVHDGKRAPVYVLSDAIIAHLAA